MFTQIMLQCHLYNNNTFALSNDPAKAIASFISDELGIISKFNLPSAMYYLNAIKKTDTIVQYRLQKQIDLTAVAFVKDTMLIKK
ncbi:hypothetical protein [Longitalea luteola]|uniref:hypothetical protein n=1 Tax=Longitalea luteola TaxID=2812563 RepID=UPI001A960BAB|nr:hypothetical protein [Longitalea luteola]